MTNIILTTLLAAVVASAQAPAAKASGKVKGVVTLMGSLGCRR